MSALQEHTPAHRSNRVIKLSCETCEFALNAPVPKDTIYIIGKASVTCIDCGETTTFNEED